MTKFFYEFSLIPSAYFELFTDFALELTQEAIEEIKCSDFSEWMLYNVSLPNLKKATIVMRMEKDPSDIIEDFQSFAKQISSRMEEEVGFAYKIEKKKNQDWIDNYKKAITPLECGGFYIHPSWYENHPKLKNIILDPALAFGSGHHATTFMCIELLSQLDLKTKKVLDVGCGSGILSLVAKKNGAIVHMCDTDSLAIEESKKNFSLNNEIIDKIWEGSLKKVENQTYDVVVANILADIIKMLYYNLCCITHKGSVIILSGILEIYKDSVIEKFNDFDLCEVLHKDEWVALKMIKR